MPARSPTRTTGTRLVLPGGGRLCLADGQASAEFRDVVHFDLALDYRGGHPHRPLRRPTVAAETLAQAIGLFQALGKKVSVIGDVPGHDRGPDGRDARRPRPRRRRPKVSPPRRTSTPRCGSASTTPCGPSNGARELGRALGARPAGRPAQAAPPDATRRPSRSTATRTPPRSGMDTLMTTAKRDTYTPETLLTVAVGGVQRARLRRHVHGAPLQGRRDLQVLDLPPCARARRSCCAAPSAAPWTASSASSTRSRRRAGTRRRAAGVRDAAHGRGPDSRAAVRHAAAAGARQHHHRAVGAGAAPRVRPPGRRTAEGGGRRRGPARRRGGRGWRPGCSSA